MENLCDSANNGREGTYDVLYLPTEFIVVRERVGETIRMSEEQRNGIEGYEGIDESPE